MSLLFWTASLALVQWASAVFNSYSQSNVAVYWGQNSYGQVNSQKRLSTYCSTTKVNIIPLAFMNGIIQPQTNFANAFENCTLYSGTQLWNCPQIEEDIKICQKIYSKTILLSLGGATYVEGGFPSTHAAIAAATNVWNLFGPNTTNSNRPFRTAIVDGFDFDFEASTRCTAPFAQTLRNLMNTATSAGGKKYYLTAAPQCPYPDAAQKDILSAVALDFVMVQFYNNYCGIQSFARSSAKQNAFNMDTWDTWAKTRSKNSNVKILLGIPASMGAAGSGYLSASALAPVISYCKTFSSFGGIMMWDMSQMAANRGFLKGVSAALAAPAIALGSSTTSASSTASSRPSPVYSPTASSSLAGLSATGICNCPLATTVTITATVFTTLGSATNLNTTTTSPNSTNTSSSNSQTSSVASLIPQWGQCGGIGYTGPTLCAPPYTCVVLNEWWSDCR